MTVGERIRSKRRENDLTQKELGEISGVAEISIRNYENERRLPQSKQLGMLAKALGTSADYLLTGEVVRSASMSDLWTYRLEEKLKHIGYSINGDPAEGYQWINYPDGTLEVTDGQLKKLNRDADIYLKFLLHTLKEQNIKNFRPEK